MTLLKLSVQVGLGLQGCINMDLKKETQSDKPKDMAKLHVKIVQQNDTKLVAEYTGKTETHDVSGKVLVDLKTLANPKVVEAAVRVAVRDHYLKTRYVGYEFDQEVIVDAL